MKRLERKKKSEKARAMIEEIHKENIDSINKKKSSGSSQLSLSFDRQNNNYGSLVNFYTPSSFYSQSNFSQQKTSNIDIPSKISATSFCGPVPVPGSGFDFSAVLDNSSDLLVENSSDLAVPKNSTDKSSSDATANSVPPAEQDFYPRSSFSRQRSRRKKSAESSSGYAANLSFLFSSTPRLASSQDWFASTTERFMNKHGYKPQLSKLVKAMDEAFVMIESGIQNTYVQAVDNLLRMVDEAWRTPKIGRDLVIGMCDHFRRSGCLDAKIRRFLDDKAMDIKTRVGELLDAFMSPSNRDYLMQAGYTRDFVKAVIRYGCDEREHRRQIALSLLEPFLKHGADVCRAVAELGCLDLLLQTCKINLRVETLLCAAVDMATVALFGGLELRKTMVDLQIPTWLFVLVNHNDVRLRFYGCLTICLLASERELEERVDKSNNLSHVDSLLRTYRPDYLAKLDAKFRSGRSSEWLVALIPLLNSKRKEIQALAAFQFAMEASLRKGTPNIEIFEEIGAVYVLRNLASTPSDSLAVKFAVEVLETIGEIVPRRLCQIVPLWTVEDVQFWVTQIGFGDVAHNFAKYRVDGDLLLRTTDENLINEIGLTSKYERMRFERELRSLKCSADYSCLDLTRLDLWLMQVDKTFCVYTYQMLHAGVDRKSLSNLNDDLLKDECGVFNGVHRQKILQAIQEVKHVDDLELSMQHRHIDVFICYRRATGSQLASLLKVHLQLRGYKVFIDVDRLFAGQIDTSLLKNIRAAKHFILVLTPHSMDRCIGDDDLKDWVHIEIRTALEANRNVVPVQDKSFEWPDEHLLPRDIQPIRYFNVVNWVHEYQEACVEKLEKFLKGERDPEPVIATTPVAEPETVPPLPAVKSASLLFSQNSLRKGSIHDAYLAINGNRLSLRRRRRSR